MDSKEADEKIQEAQESSSPKAVESINSSPPVVGIELNPSTPQKEGQSPPEEDESAIEKDEEIEDPATQEHNEADKTKESSLEKSDERYKSNEDKELISQEFEFDPEGKEEGNLQDQQYESQFQGDHSCLDTPEKPSEDLSGEIYQNLEEKEKKETVNLTEEQKQDQNIKEEGCHEEIPTVEADDADQVEDPQDISYSSPENQIIVKSPEDGHLKCSPCHPNPLHHSRMDTDNQDDEEDEDTGDILKTLDDSQEEANQNPLIKENDTTENQQDIHQEIVATEESEPKFEEQDEGEKDQQDYIEEDGPNHTLETQLETDQDVENNPPD